MFIVEINVIWPIVGFSLWMVSFSVCLSTPSFFVSINIPHSKEHHLMVV